VPTRLSLKASRSDKKRKAVAHSTTEIAHKSSNKMLACDEAPTIYKHRLLDLKDGGSTSPLTSHWARLADSHSGTSAA